MNNDIKRIINNFEIKDDKIIVHFRKGKDCIFDNNLDILKAIISKMEKQHEKDGKRIKKYSKATLLLMLVGLLSVFLGILASSSAVLDEITIGKISNILIIIASSTPLPVVILTNQITKMESTAEFIKEKKEYLKSFEESMNSTQENTKQIIETKTEPIALTLNPEPIKYESNLVKARRR